MGGEAGLLKVSVPHLFPPGTVERGEPLLRLPLLSEKDLLPLAGIRKEERQQRGQREPRGERKVLREWRELGEGVRVSLALLGGAEDGVAFCGAPAAPRGRRRELADRVGAGALARVVHLEVLELPERELVVEAAEEMEGGRTWGGAGGGGAGVPAGGMRGVFGGGIWVCVGGLLRGVLGGAGELVIGGGRARTEAVK